MSISTCQFEIPTRDGRTYLKGQIDLPMGEIGSRYPAVLIANGGWFMERDGFMGNSGTERDLVYKELARELVTAGIAVVRYDNRGVFRNEMTMPVCPVGSSDDEITRHYFRTCINAEVRQTVSVQTQMDDVEAVWNFMIDHPRVESQRVVIWAHSEGGLNVGRLIGGKRICPLGSVIVGSAATSPADLVHWTMVDRYAEYLMRWDTDADGRVTEADVERHFPNDHFFLAAAITPQMLTPPNEGWILETARDNFEKIYAQAKAAAQARPDDAQYPDPSQECLTVAASNNWWRQWFEDTKPMIDHFAEYRGYASFHIGEIDSQFSGPREMTFAQGRINSGLFTRVPRLVLHQGRGHSLRTGEPAAGPMDDEAKACLTREICEIMAEG